MNTIRRTVISTANTANSMEKRSHEELDCQISQCVSAPCEEDNDLGLFVSETWFQSPYHA